MEALLIVFGGPLIVEILLPLLSLVAYSLCAAIVGFIDLLFAALTLCSPRLRASRPVKKSKVEAEDSAVRANSASKRKRLRLLIRVVSILGGLVLVFLLLIETFFFKQTIEYLFRTASSRVGGTIDARMIGGSIFAGRVDLGDVTLRRSDHRNSNYDIRIQKLSIDVDMLSMLSASKTVESIFLSDAKGSFSCLSRPGNVKKRKQYVIEQLSISSTSIDISDHCVDDGSADFALQIEDFISHSLRSGLLPFDVLFNSNGKVKIDNGQLLLSNSRGQQGRASKWEGIDLPIQVFRHYLGRPMLIISSGTLDISVVNRWPSSNTSNPEIETEWRLLLKDLTAAMPPSFTVKERLVATPAVKFLNTIPGNLPLSFKVAIKQSGVDFVYSALTDSLASALYDGLQTLRSKTLGVTKEKLLKSGREKVKEFKELFPEMKFKRERPENVQKER